MRPASEYELLPAAHETSRLPCEPGLMRTVAQAALLLLACVAVVWCVVFVGLCVLLARTNTEAVRGGCAGFWDCMLVATLAPIGAPLVYCLTAPCMLLAWRPYSAACGLVLAVVCLYSSLSAAQSPTCVDALRRATPPMPLLIYVGFIKSALFATATLTVAH
jgi:hypothetical protein